MEEGFDCILILRGWPRLCFSMQTVSSAVREIKLDYVVDDTDVAKGAEGLTRSLLLTGR